MFRCKYVFISFLSLLYYSIGKTPWFIAYDEKYDSIVISIRGTWSLKDVVTDLMAGHSSSIESSIEVHSLEDDGIEYGFDGKNEYTHEVRNKPNLLNRVCI